MSIEQIPLHSYDLIDALDKAFPHRCARPEMSTPEIFMEAGARQVIDLLLRLRHEEQENPLGD